jgi:hypothetical protein
MVDIPSGRVRDEVAGGDRARRELTEVVEHDDPVAQEAPPLLGVRGHGTCELTRRVLG